MNKLHMHQFRTLKKSENLHINLVNGKTFADCIYCSNEAFATKRKKMYFLLLVFVNFLVMLLFLVIILLQLWKVINIVCINTTNFK